MIAVRNWITADLPTDYSRAAQLARVAENRWKFVPSITITGFTATGKTAIVTELKRRYGEHICPKMEFVSVGELMAEFLRGGKSSSAHDKEELLSVLGQGEVITDLGNPDDYVDRFVQNLDPRPHYVIDGRIPHALCGRHFHVLLTCEYEVRAERRMRDQRQNPARKDKKTILAEIKRRDQVDIDRLSKRRPGSIWQEPDFDFVCRTDKYSICDSVDLIVSDFISWLDYLRSISQLEELPAA